MVGTNPFIKVISYEAQAGLEALATAKIDRGREWIGIGKVIGHSFGMSRSTYKAMYRRKVILNMLSLNAASKYIPLMYDCLKHEIGEWEVGKTLDSVYEMNVLTFGFFTVVFFGQDTLQISKSTIPFEEDDGRIVDKTMMDFLIATLKNIFQGLIHPIASLAPFLAENDL